MGKKLFVSNIDFDATEDELKEVFEAIGATASVVIATDRESGRSKGFAFVEMSSEELARKAVDELNGTALRGRPLKVNEDRGRGGGHAAGGGPGGDAGGDGEGGPRQREFLPPMQRINLFRRRKKLDPFVEDPTRTIDYKDVSLLSRFVSEGGKIMSRRFTGLNAYNQRRISKAIKRAQSLGLISPTGNR